MTGNFRAKELTPRANKTSFRCSRKASIDIASDFFRNSFIRTPQSLSSLPPFRADLNKAAENTRNLMNEITFMKEKSNVNSNSNFQSPSNFTYLSIKKCPSFTKTVPIPLKKRLSPFYFCAPLLLTPNIV